MYASLPDNASTDRRVYSSSIWQVYKPLALTISTCRARGICFVPVHLGLQQQQQQAMTLPAFTWVCGGGSGGPGPRLNSCSRSQKRIPPTRSCSLKSRMHSICVPLGIQPDACDRPSISALGQVSWNSTPIFFSTLPATPLPCMCLLCVSNKLVSGLKTKSFLRLL